MSDALRLELHPFNIRVVLIAPGPIRTQFGQVAASVAEERPDSPYWSYLQRWQTTRRKSDRLSRSPGHTGATPSTSVYDHGNREIGGNRSPVGPGHGHRLGATPGHGVAVTNR
jgi:hypothetical protein